MLLFYILLENNSPAALKILLVAPVVTAAGFSKTEYCFRLNCSSLVLLKGFVLSTANWIM
jgi:hypothetical protein